MENKISISIPEDVFRDALAKLEAVKTALTPYLVALTPEQRRAMVKMGDKTMAFVEKAVEYASQKSTLVPAYLDMAEWQKDERANQQLRQLFRLCEQLYSTMDDTAMLCGSESYVSALTFYNNVKQAAKTNVPDAKPIMEDLAKRFPGRTVAIKPATKAA